MEIARRLIGSNGANELDKTGCREPSPVKWLSGGKGDVRERTRIPMCALFHAPRTRRAWAIATGLCQSFQPRIINDLSITPYMFSDTITVSPIVTYLSAHSRSKVPVEAQVTVTAKTEKTLPLSLRRGLCPRVCLCPLSFNSIAFPPWPPNSLPSPSWTLSMPPPLVCSIVKSVGNLC